MADSATALRDSWQRLSSWVTLVTLLAVPTLVEYFHIVQNWSLPKSFLWGFGIAIIFRGVLELLFRKTLPWPTLFDTESRELKETDIMNRRRFWFWRFWARFTVGYAIICTISWIFKGGSWVDKFTSILPHLLNTIAHPSWLLQMVQVLALFMVNFLIFMGPLMLMGVSQIKTYEPGDANWGVKLDDVRGQKEAKEEVRRIVQIWQSGEAFEKAGGKRERGLLFLGPPGVGKTTGFNAPFITIPGSGFAATFIGIDALIVRFLARKAKKVSRKWGGQAIIFIDEIDAVGMSRNRGGGGGTGPGGMFGGMMGGQLALNQILVVMDSIDSPPMMKMALTKKLNTLLDAIFIVPRNWGKLKLRLPPPKPRKDQVFWVGATNAPLEALDSALTRPGRMGRHVWFRQPTKEDRKDIFDLYLGKVNHEAELDTPERREEIARVTKGSSPAQIEQMCSMALLNAQHDGRTVFNWQDLVEALTTLEAGTAVGQDYTEAETRAVAIHESGHAIAGHVYLPDVESTRLSIRMRGASLGHHQSFDTEERHSYFRKEEIGHLVHMLGSMAAELVFYDDTTQGVTGDLQMATSLASMMAEMHGMSPVMTSVYSDSTKTEKIVRDRFVRIGRRLMSTSGEKPKTKEAQVAEFLGHAFVTAYNCIRINKDAVERVANTLIERKEIFGNDLVSLLNEQELETFDHMSLFSFDLTEDDVWPNM